MMPRYFGLDTHKESVIAAAVDAEQQLVLAPRKIPMNQLADWAGSQLTAQDESVGYAFLSLIPRLYIRTSQKCISHSSISRR